MDTSAPVPLPTSATITGRLVLRCWLRGIRAIPTADGLVLEPAGVLPEVEAAWLEQHRAETLAAQAALSALGRVPSVSDDPAVMAAIEAYRADSTAMTAIANEYGTAKAAELKAAVWYLRRLAEANGPADAVAAEAAYTRDRTRKLIDELGVTFSRQVMADAAAFESNKGD